VIIYICMCDNCCIYKDDNIPGFSKYIPIDVIFTISKLFNHIDITQYFYDGIHKPHMSSPPF